MKSLPLALAAIVGLGLVSAAAHAQTPDAGAATPPAARDAGPAPAGDQASDQQSGAGPGDAAAATKTPGAEAATKTPSATPEQAATADKAQPSTGAGGKAAIRPKATPAAHPGAPDKAPKRPLARLSGYLLPGFGLLYRPDAVPRDQYQYGFSGDAALIVDAHPWKMWSGRLNVLFRHTAYDVVTGVELIDRNGDGVPDGIQVTRQSYTGLSIQEATIDFAPVARKPRIDFRAGAMRIPFTVEQQLANTALMFPTRSQPNEAFVSGPDIGLLAHAAFGDGLVNALVGVFNGDSLGLRLQNTVARGLVYTARVDVNPFGGFPLDAGDHDQGPFRLGLGGGLMVRPATLYDNGPGYQATQVVDLRLAGSLRAAYRGLYLAVEYLRRQQTDNFTDRPQIDEGAYGEVSFFWHLTRSFAVEPIARLGYIVEGLSFEPRTIGSVDAGVNLYPRADAHPVDGVRLTLHYLGERRFTENETAHGFETALQLLF